MGSVKNENIFNLKTAGRVRVANLCRRGRFISTHRLRQSFRLLNMIRVRPQQAVGQRQTTPQSSNADQSEGSAPPNCRRPKIVNFIPTTRRPAPSSVDTAPHYLYLRVIGRRPAPKGAALRRHTAVGREGFTLVRAWKGRSIAQVPRCRIGPPIGDGDPQRRLPAALPVAGRPTNGMGRPRGHVSLRLGYRIPRHQGFLPRSGGQVKVSSGLHFRMCQNDGT